MITAEKFKKFLLENCVNEEGDIEICDIDLSDFDRNVFFDNWKVKYTISLNGTEAETICNRGQIAKNIIDNACQVARREIINDFQEANKIYNEVQESRDRIVNSGQKSNVIINKYQRADEIINTKKEEK